MVRNAWILTLLLTLFLPKSTICSRHSQNTAIRSSTACSLRTALFGTIEETLMHLLAQGTDLKNWFSYIKEYSNEDKLWCIVVSFAYVRWLDPAYGFLSWQKGDIGAWLTNCNRNASFSTNNWSTCFCQAEEGFSEVSAFQRRSVTEKLYSCMSPEPELGKQGITWKRCPGHWKKGVCPSRALLFFIIL